MAKLLLVTLKTLKATIYLFMLTVILQCVNSARILDEVDGQPQVVPNPTVPIVPGTSLPSGQTPAIVPTPVTSTDDAEPPVPETDEDPDLVPPPVEDVAPVVVTPPVATTVTPVVSPATTASPSGAAAGTSAVAATSSTVGSAGSASPPLSFFMHDILGGSHPSARVVTGIIANSGVNGLPFSKPSSSIFPINGGVPLVTGNINGIVTNNNVPFLAGLNGAQGSTIIQNSGNNNVVNGGGNQPFVTAGQLPAGAVLQKLMFGTITVIDDELTEGHELGSAVLGKAQGFYLASSLDGTSQTVALTALFQSSDHGLEDTISFFGVHRTASPVSQIAIVGGTGKYENAEGYATIETIHKEDQHTTDGVDTILQFSVYLTE